MVIFIVIMLVLLCLGLAYSIYGVYTAEVDKFNIEEPFDEKTFSKPKGWKVGEIPKGGISTPPFKEGKIIIQEKISIKSEKAVMWDRRSILKKTNFKFPWLSKSENSDPMIP